MSGKRPPGPVIRWDTGEDDEMPDTALQTRYEFLAAGAEVAAHLTVAAREKDVSGLGWSVVGLTRDQLEAAAMAFALLAASGAPVVDE